MRIEAEIQRCTDTDPLDGCTERWTQAHRHKGAFESIARGVHGSPLDSIYSGPSQWARGDVGLKPSAAARPDAQAHIKKTDARTPETHADEPCRPNSSPSSESSTSPISSMSALQHALCDAPLPRSSCMVPCSSWCNELTATSKGQEQQHRAEEGKRKDQTNLIESAYFARTITAVQLRC